MNSQSGESEFIRRLFEEHVPSIASGTVDIRGIVREPGNRSIVVVVQKDPAVDAVGACVGDHHSRVKRIAAELRARAPKECLDIVRWDNSVELFIANLVAPSKLAETSFDEATRQVRVVLARDSTQPPGLALRAQALWQLTGWRLSVESPDER